ncbi:MAG: sugar nucleotide-binding protein, partial [Chitinispirillaceae bacterium]|nr:sugar nucleotide-binding protein [Chitinispirillaceae bacterium]
MISRILITGASGFLGWNLCRSAVAKGLAVTGIYNSKTIKIAGADTIQCDLGDYASVKELIDKIRPDAVIHAAAMAVPDECQKNPVLSRKINVEASIGLAGICADRNISCVFTSTDLVFDGKKGRYSETSGTCPISLYGEQKLEAEAGMRERYPGVTICRMPL